MTRPEIRATAIPLTIATAIAVFALLAPGYPVIGLLFVPPVVASLNAGVRGTAIVSSLCIALALVLAASTGSLDSVEHLTRVLTVVAGAVVAMLIASGVERRRRVERALLGSEERLRVTLEGTDTGSWDLDMATGSISWSDRLAQLFGLQPDRTPASIDGLEALIHPDDRGNLREVVRRAVRDGTDFQVEFRAIWPDDGSEHWIEARGHAEGDATGEAEQFVGIAADVTTRKRNEQGFEFLAKANAILDSSLDLETVLQQLADVTVPALADVCMVDVLEDGAVRRVGVALADETAREAVQTLKDQRLDLESDHAIVVAMRTGELQVIDRVTDDVKRVWASSDEHLEALRRFPARSAVMAPMKSGDRVLGTMAMASFKRESAFGSFEVWLIDELARRAASAISNARRYGERAQIAATLQRSLLPNALPDIEGLDLAACYRPGGRGLEVGGDFYDAFQTANGSWGMLIGDVSGKGAQAAAATSLARHTARAVAMRESSPCRILGLVNRSLMEEFEAHQFCTMACVTATSTADGVEFLVSLGGHPRPLVIRADGAIEAVGEPGSLLGAFDEPRLHDERFQLRPGDSLILFTDGLTEAKTSETERLGDEGLEAILDTWQGSGAGDLVAHVESALAARREGYDRDDLAVLVVRPLAVDAEAHGDLGAGAAARVTDRETVG